MWMVENSYTIDHAESINTQTRQICGHYIYGIVILLNYLRHLLFASSVGV